MESFKLKEKGKKKNKTFLNDPGGSFPALVDADVGLVMTNG